LDTVRDLARGDPWQESLERSLARREAAKRPDPGPIKQTARRPRPERPVRGRSRRETWRHLTASFAVWTDRALALRSRIPTLGPRGVAATALLAAIIASSLADSGSHASQAAARATTSRAAFVSHRSRLTTPGGAGAAVRDGSCPLVVSTAGYANPLVGATVKPERIDQGVDYAGSGTLVAIGAARVTRAATTNTGWPGAFIEYQLLRGADAGCYVYYAEGVIPADGLTVGQTVAAGQPIASIIPKYPSGIELGWASGIATKAYAKVAGQWSPTDDADNVATAAGKSFSALIAALGGPPGKVEG
jgi:murein DD-endopeptidase MepM/ murein hydrolase activator NlpD